MKTRFAHKLISSSLFAILAISCAEKKESKTNDVALNSNIEESILKPAKKELSKEFKAYWYAGEAEITSYKLEQERYGEMREGKSVLIYVTEPFLADKQVKADGPHSDNIPVLKLNMTKNYLTGIYPYSIMSSSFYPVHDHQHAVKVSFSAQEWCGQVYAQLNNREKFEVMSHSYFEREADQDLVLDKTILENELWNKIRINPTDLPQGDLEVIPSMEYIRLSHKEFKAYKANASITLNDTLNTYTVSYPELGRSLKIIFTAKFPHTIEKWEETQKTNQGTQVSKATKISAMNTPYWRQNSNEYLYLRDSLGL